MHDIINFLKGAVEREARIAVNGCYIIRNGAIYATSMAMTAGIAMEWKDGSFNVPAPALDVALGRMKDISSLKYNQEKETLTIRAGKLHSTIRCVSDEPIGVPDMPDDEEWQPCPPNLCTAISLALPFINEGTTWTSCVCLAPGRVFALSNAKAIEVEVDGLDLKPALLVAKVAEFLVSQGVPDEYAPFDNFIFFRWEDGRWLKAQLFDTKGVEVEIADKIFGSAGDEAPVVIDESFREAFADAAGLAVTHILRITPEGIDARGESIISHVEHPIEGLPEGHVTYWDARIIEKAVGVASAWNPAGYPNPCLFVGSGFRGVLMGRSKWDD